jgi:Flp pilus assembly protein TadD
LKFQSDVQLVVVARPLDMSANRVFLPQSVSVNSNGQFEVRVSPGKIDIQFVALESAGFRVHANSTNTHTQTTIADGESAELSLAVSTAKVNASLPDEKIAALIDEATNLIRNQQFQAAIDKLNRVVAESPALALPWIVRAEAYENLGQIPQAKEQYEQLLKSDPPKQFSILARNNLAFLLATEIDENLRDGKRAVKLASEALDLSGGDQPDVLDTLSAAYAETGDFEQAVKTIQKAIQLAPDNESFRKHLDLYQSNRAVRATHTH